LRSAAVACQPSALRWRSEIWHRSYRDPGSSLLQPFHVMRIGGIHDSAESFGHRRYKGISGTDVMNAV